MGPYKRNLRRASLLMSVDGDPSACKPSSHARMGLANVAVWGLAVAAILCLLATTSLRQLLGSRGGGGGAGAGAMPGRARMPAQRYPPSLYLQAPGSQSPDTRWYVVSAFMDTRPLAFGEPAGVTLVASGPREEVRKGKSWVASIVRLGQHHRHDHHHLFHSQAETGGPEHHRNDEIARIQCAPTHFVWFDTHPNNATHSGATIFCADEGAWSTLQSMPDVALGVCLMNDAGSGEGCPPRSVVPISLPFNYPDYPTTWGAALLRETFGGAGAGAAVAEDAPTDPFSAMLGGGSGSGGDAAAAGGAGAGASAAGGAAAGGGATTTNTGGRAPAGLGNGRSALARMEGSLRGDGDIAMCISPISSGMYTSTLRFFLQYYGQMGVDHVYMYMRRPSDTFRALVEGMVDEQRTMRVKDDTPTLELVPWCLQQDATYGCAPGQHKLEPGFFNVAASNFGQILQIQDCFLRAVGRFRWMITVDLDEYLVPHVPYVQNLHDMIAANVLREASGRSVAPSEIRFQTAFFEPCTPGDDDRALMSQQSHDAFFLREPESYPRPVWAAARVSEMFDPVTRSKFMCDTLTCDRVGIHFGFTTLCDRFKERAAWPMACTSAPVYEMPTEQVLIHHTRAQFAADAVVHKCSEHPKRNATDWTFANFIFGQRIRSQASRRVARSQKGGGGGGGGVRGAAIAVLPSVRQQSRR